MASNEPSGYSSAAPSSFTEDSVTDAPVTVASNEPSGYSSTAPSTFTADSVYHGFSEAHNIAINEDTGFAYLMGSDICEQKVAILDIRTPTLPLFKGCHGNDGYIHDAHCVVYKGPDTRYSNREICFLAALDEVVVMDVTDKSSPVRLSSGSYDDHVYST